MILSVFEIQNNLNNNKYCIVCKAFEKFLAWHIFNIFIFYLLALACFYVRSQIVFSFSNLDIDLKKTKHWTTQRTFIFKSVQTWQVRTNVENFDKSHERENLIVRPCESPPLSTGGGPVGNYGPTSHKELSITSLQFHDNGAWRKMYFQTLMITCSSEVGLSLTWRC